MISCAVAIGAIGDSGLTGLKARADPELGARPLLDFREAL